MEMTPTEIRARIETIDRLQAAHEARDLDGEMLAVMQAGGDIDALESRQLEAERTSRRLRVERKALEAAMPEAVRSEVRDQISVLAEEIRPVHDEQRRIVAELVDLDAKRTAALDALGATIDRLESAEAQARQITSAGKVGGVAAHVDSTMAKDLIEQVSGNLDLNKVPEATRVALGQYLQTRAIKQDHARHAEFMRQLAQERAAN